MAIRAADAEAMVRAADQAGVVLAVGLYRRLLPVSRLLRGMLESGMLGRPLWVDIEEGGEYSWELATLSVLTRAGGGGGVLIDLGTHLLDQLFFLLPGDGLGDALCRQRARRRRDRLRAGAGARTRGGARCPPASS